MGHISRWRLPYWAGLIRDGRVLFSMLYLVARAVDPADGQISMLLTGSIQTTLVVDAIGRLNLCALGIGIA
jgi:hypothetical protein